MPQKGGCSRRAYVIYDGSDTDLYPAVPLEIQ